jgi:hypothetical protein
MAKRLLQPALLEAQHPKPAEGVGLAGLPRQDREQHAGGVIEPATLEQAVGLPE